MNAFRTVACALLFAASSAPFATSAGAATLTLINSNAQAQVARSGTPNPNNILQNDPFSVEINEPRLGGFSAADALAGVMRFFTSTGGISGVTGTTNSTVLDYRFVYRGAAPLVLPEGALSYRATGTMSRVLGPRTPSDPVVSAQTQINSTFVSQVGFAGNVAGNARVAASEGSTGNLLVTPIQNNLNIGLTIVKLDDSGLDALYRSRATTLMDGDTLQFQVSMSGNATQTGVNPNAIFGVNATTDGSNTGVLSLVLPFGVSVAGLPSGQSLSWVTNAPAPHMAPIPVPMSMPLLGSGLLLFGSLARRRKTRAAA